MILEIDQLSHQYGDKRAVDDISFSIDSGELVALLGPSGCGKTTLVQAIAGHIQPGAGNVLLRGENVTTEPPELRRVGVVFQQPTLFPHMTVSENVEYGLAAKEIDDGQRETVVTEYLELVDLSDQRDAYPVELSGGQKRRVELARALAPQPDVLLLDEPLSALDRSLRDQLREEIGRIQRETGVTTLFVTHDQEDAMVLADRLVVMNDGSVSGTGHPRTLYQSPPNPFVASFLGRSNTLSATVIETEPLKLSLGRQDITLHGSEVAAGAGSTVTCHIRPEDISLQSTATDARIPSLDADIADVSDIGRRYDVTVTLPTGETLVVEQSNDPPDTDDTLSVEMPVDRISVFDSAVQ